MTAPGSFTSLILNLDTKVNGTVDFRAVDTMGDIFTFNNIALGRSGSNFFTFTTIKGQRIANVSFVSDAPLAFMDAAQFRIGGALLDTAPLPPGVPEPASVLMMGAGLIAVARRLRKV